MFRHCQETRSKLRFVRLVEIQPPVHAAIRGLAFALALADGGQWERASTRPMYNT